MGTKKLQGVLLAVFDR